MRYKKKLCQALKNIKAIEPVKCFRSLGSLKFLQGLATQGLLKDLISMLSLGASFFHMPNAELIVSAYGSFFWLFLKLNEMEGNEYFNVFE